MPGLASKQYSVGTWRSLVAYLNGVQGVPGSNPGVPTIFLPSAILIRADNRSMRDNREAAGVGPSGGEIHPSWDRIRPELNGSANGAKGPIAIVAARFHSALCDELVRGAVNALLHHGIPPEHVEIVRVPGAWEVPLALGELAQQKRYAALVALAVVIRGETSHFDYICTEATRGCADVSLRHRVPVGFGVLTCETIEQARARTGGTEGNKGWEAAEAALEMADLYSHLQGSGV